MVVIAFLALNAANGLTFACYGVMVPFFERDLHAPRSLASSGLGMMILVIGLLGPLTGSMLSRLSIRWIMITGAAFNIAGYLLLSILNDMWAILAVYLTLIGPGAMMLGSIPCATLVSRWFSHRRGFALGMINMPAFITIAPFIAVPVLVNLGMRPLFLMLAGAFVVLLPVLLLVIDQPSKVSQEALGEGDAAEASDQSMAVPASSYRDLLRNRRYLLSCAGISLIFAGGPMLYPHLIPLLMDRGMDLGHASTLLAILGGAGVAGAIGFGWLADRIGPQLTLAAVAGCQVLLWGVLLIPSLGFYGTLPIIAIIGMCTSAAQGAYGMLLAELLGRSSMSRGLGLSVLIDIIFVAGAAPVAGIIVDRTGSYAIPLTVHITAFAVSTMIFLLLARKPRVAARGNVKPA